MKKSTVIKHLTALIAALLLFALLSSMTLSAATADETFSDVETGKWYTDAVNFCYQNGYMAGISNKVFGTNISITRAMFATIIASFDEANRSEYGNRGYFKDVASGKWYTSSVEWAFDNAVVAGVGNGSFAPGATITRESIALMLYKYALISGIDTGRTADISSFSDACDVHEWARKAVEWAVGNSIIAGNNNTLLPRKTATRAEVAVMLTAFTKLGHVCKAGDFSVSRAFSDNMIVQRDEKLTVWGFAPESENGKLIRVYFRGSVACAIIENGEWKAVFAETFPADASMQTIRVKGVTKETDINNVMTGDVYYVIGQSNVFWSMQLLLDDLVITGNYDSLDYDYDDSRNIRFFCNSSSYYINRTGEDRQGTVKVYKDVEAKEARWMKPSDAMISDFSAIGYLTAYNISKQTDIPVGMIEIDASGLPLTAFAPNELCDKWGSDVNYMDTGVYFFKLGDTVYPLASRFAFNQQLYPLLNFSCAGIIWYQGESDSQNTILNFGKDKYVFQNEFVELMQYYRSHMGNSDFPVYIMEFPPSYGFQTDSFIPFGTVRSEMGVIPTLLENSYMISSSDFWPIERMSWWNNLHPYCKPEQAKRTAEMICANRYGIGKTDYVCGPQFAGIEYTDEYTAVITFKYTGDGLDFNNDEDTDIISGFETLTSPNSYSEGWHVNYRAEITGRNEVTITDSVPIYGVRYNAQTEYYSPFTCNMYNSAKVPMIAFADYKN